MTDTARARGPRLAGGALVLGVLAGLAVWVVTAHGGGPRERTVAASAQSDPCAYADIPIDVYGGDTFRNPPEIASKGRRLKTSLTAEYTDPEVTEIAGCPVRLRTYEGELVGPTLRLRPGQTLDLNLRNDLPKQSRAEAKSDIAQETDVANVAVRPHPFNVTNLHTHGLHVSPRGNGDNVLLAVHPQKTQPYDIPIPGDHAPGTFWYHAHGHGSTAIQVGSGMAGAIVIEDDPDAIPPALAAANEGEKVMLFQTILYDTEGEVETLTAFFPDPKTPPNPDPCAEQSPACTWQGSKRRTTINGQVVPTIYMQPGEVQRWRMIDGGFRETLEIQLEGHSLHEIALDGLYLGGVDTWGPGQSVELQPGYRSDVLVQASMDEGTYRLFDAPTSEDDALHRVIEDQEVLAEVVVRGEPVDMELPTDEEMAALAPYGGLDLREQATGVQVADFRVGHDLVPKPQQRLYFQINYQAFDPKHVRRLALGSVDQWSLGTTGDPSDVPNPFTPGNHVFHIHVNPFQVEREGPNGIAELVWKDTLIVTPDDDPVSVFTKYTDFTGKFVIHCHILDHEDLGMMEVVKVVRPGALLDKSPPHH